MSIPLGHERPPILKIYKKRKGASMQSLASDPLVKLKEEYSIDAYSLADGNHKIRCPECQPPHNSRDRPLSVTIDGDGVVFNCHHCGYKGGVRRDDVMPSLKKKSVENVPFDAGTSSFLDMFFKSRGIGKDTYKSFNVFSKDNDWIAFPYNGRDHKCDNIKYRDKEKNFRQVKNGKKTLYNYESVRDAKTVVFVEGEMDVLSLWEAGIKSCTTLPDGAPAMAAFKENDKRFAPLQTHPLQATKIILFVDADSAGENLRKELLHRYGKQVCWYVVPIDGCKDANDVLVKHGVEALRGLIDSAKPYPVDGLYTVKNYSSDVVDLYDGNYAKPVHVGYPSLDRLYGVMKGTLHVWTGIPNHGKSTFLDQCLVALAKKHNWKFAVFSPEHSTQMHIRRLVQIVSQKPFDKGIAGRMSREELGDSMKWVQSHFYFIETREHTPNAKKILEIAGGSVKKFGCNGIVIDPYNEVDASRKGSYREDEHIRDFISSCKRFCRLHDIVMWIVAHPTKLPKDNDGRYSPPTAYDIAGASHWHNQSDAILTVHRDFDNNKMSVLTRKIREQGLYGQIGEATFFYNKSKCIFEEDVSVSSGWADQY